MAPTTKTALVAKNLSEPHAHIRIRVEPVTRMGDSEPFAHTVVVQNTSTGMSQRSYLEYAEAEAKAVLAAIRAYRRKNPGAS